MKNKMILIIITLIFLLSLIIVTIIYKNISTNKINDNVTTSDLNEENSNDVISLTSSNYKDEVESTDKIVLIDFFATWCSPCKIMSPIVDDIASSNKEKVKVCKVDIDKQSSLSKRFNVSSIPAIFIMKNNKVITSFIGVQTKDVIQKAIDNIN